MNRQDWEKVKHLCTFVKISKRFRPFGTAYHQPIRGKAKVTLRAETGATIESYVYVIDDKQEQSLLGEQDAIRLSDEDGMSQDPDKCKIIKQWPQPKSSAEVKSFLQTVQFNAKFLAGRHGDIYPELIKPLGDLTKKNVRIHWGQEQEEAFQQVKDRLCSDDILVSYDTSLETRLYVDSSPIGTQATVAQKYHIDNEDVWRPVNYTSRPWTPAEAGYGQIERESNGILTGIHMNKMNTLGTHIEVVTDHAPLLPAYNTSNKPKQLRVDRHRIKLLPFWYNVVYEPGKITPCDYGSHHPPPNTDFTEEERVDWATEDETDTFVNQVMQDQLPQGIILEILRATTAIDDTAKRGG